VTLPPQLGENLRRVLACHTELVDFVLHFEFFALQRGDHQIVGLGTLQFGLDLAIQLLVAPFERRDMPFSRHDNSLKASMDKLIVTNNSRNVDCLDAWIENRVQIGLRSVNQGCVFRRWGAV
jgi:hypothetical protein